MKLDKSFCFMFLSVFFCLEGTQNTRTLFFEKITDQISRLNYAQLICEHVGSESKLICTVTAGVPNDHF